MIGWLFGRSRPYVPPRNPYLPGGTPAQSHKEIAEVHDKDGIMYYIDFDWFFDNPWYKYEGHQRENDVLYHRFTFKGDA